MIDAAADPADSGRPLLVTPEYHDRMARAHRRFQLRRPEALAFLVLSAVLVLLGILLLALGSALGAVVVVAPVVLVGIRFGLRPYAVRQALRRQVPVGSVVAAGLTPEGIWTSNATGTARLAWRELRDVRRVDDVIFVRPTVGAWIGVPDVTLPAHAEVEIRRRISSAHPAASAPAPTAETAPMTETPLARAPGSALGGSCVPSPAERRAILRSVALGAMTSPAVLPVLLAPLVLVAVGVALASADAGSGLPFLLIGVALLVLLPITVVVSVVRAAGRILPPGERFVLELGDDALTVSYPGRSVDIPWGRLRAIRRSGPLVRLLRRGAPGFFWIPAGAVDDGLVVELEARIRAAAP